MIKGFGGFAFLLFLALCAEIGTFGPGGAIWFLSLILVVTGTVASVFFYLPASFEKEGLVRLQAYAHIHPAKTIDAIHEVSSQVRKDGLLSLESVRGGITDRWLLYVTKKMMEGFDQKAILPVLQNERIRIAELFSELDTYQDRIVSSIPLYGLVGTISHLMFFLSKPESNLVSASFVPFLLSIVFQLVFSFWSQRQIDELAACSRSYHAVIEEGAAGLIEGVHADLLRDRLISRITHA